MPSFGAISELPISTLPVAPGGSTYTLDLDSASYLYTATDAGVEHGRQVTADAAAYTWTATDVDFVLDHPIVPESAAYLWTASDVALEYDREIVPDAAAYAWTADDVGVELGRQIVPDSAAYLWTANDVDLIYTPAGAYNLDLDGAAYAWTASDVRLEYGRQVDAETAAYLWTADDVALSYIPLVVQPSPALPPGGITHRAKRHRILLDDGRLYIPATEEEYRDFIAVMLERALERAQRPENARQKAKRGRKARRAISAQEPPSGLETLPAPRLPRALPAGFYEALDNRHQDVLNYSLIVEVWAAYLADEAEDEDVVVMLLS